MPASAIVGGLSLTGGQIPEARRRRQTEKHATRKPDSWFSTSRRCTRTLGFGYATYGIGGAGCTIEGEVARGDGTPVATFQQHCTKKGVGWFWTKYGESAEFQIRACLTVIGTTIAYLVDTGRYESGLRPLSAAVSPVPAVHPATTERTPGNRLRELERLRQEGLLNDREYQEKRELILKDL